MIYRDVLYCVKSGPYFPEFRLNAERYGISLRIQCQCGKIRTRKTPNTDSFYPVLRVDFIQTSIAHREIILMQNCVKGRLEAYLK